MSQPLREEAEALTQAVTQAWQGFVTTGRGEPTPHPTHVYASAWRVCDRRTVLEMVVPERQPRFDADTLARFRRGNDRERDLVADLARVGRECRPAFTVVGQQGRFDMTDRRGRQVISGRVDGFLYFGEPGVARMAPFEVKAWHPNVVDRLETIEDVFENPWTRSGGYQLLGYLYATSSPLGFLVLDRAGIPKLLPVVLEEQLERMEGFLQKAERCVDQALVYSRTRDDGDLPPYLEGDAAECTRCPFYGHTCNPPLLAPVDVQVFNDQEAELAIARLLEIREVGKEYAALDDKLKKQFRGVEVGIVGPYAITGKWSKYTGVVLPPEVKKQYTVTDPKGKFTLQFSKPNPAAPDAVPPTVTEQLQRSLELVKGARDVEAENPHGPGDRGPAPAA